MSLLGAIGTGLVSLFTSERASDTAIDAVRKIGGLDDMNAKEKADFFLNWIKATAHQSPTRRKIAILTGLGWAGVTGTWLLAKIGGQVSLFVGVAPERAAHLTKLADDLFRFCDDVLAGPYGIVIGFYFAVDFVNKARR